MRSARPWGHFEVLAHQVDFKLKRIVVQPGQRLSMQRHWLRDEHWYVLEGWALVEIDGRRQSLVGGQSVDVLAGAWHRLANAGSQPLVVLEIQSGHALAEDDIERREDDYGRGDAAARPLR